MPVFEYVALNAQGKQTKGSVDAENVRVARQKLRGQGVFPTSLKESSNTSSDQARDIKKFFQAKKVALKDLAVATRQLATLIGAGLPLVSALLALADQTDSDVLQRIIVNIRERVEEGEALAKSLAAYPQSFPRLYINMVAAGEASGTLDTVLENLADYLEAQLELRRKVTSALVYPALMMVVCSLVVSGLLVFVVPKIVEIFIKQGIPLPLPTQIMLGVSDFLVNFWIWLGVGVAVAIFALKAYYRQPKGRELMDSILLKVPLVGGIYTKICTARISRTLGTLLESGVGLLAGLDIAKNIVGNVHFSRALESAHDGVREGRPLASELSKSGLFPAMLGHMVAIGEKSGELEGMLLKAGKSYENEVNSILSGLTSLLEPLMMIVVGAIVLFIVASILLPMTDLMDVVQL